jgi:hypothetical protein
MPIIFSAHARQQMLLRGAAEDEVITTIQHAQREPALRGRFKARWSFSIDRLSPVNNQVYRFKTVEAVWAEELDNLIVVTVLVYYANEAHAP